jgi:hypothetical protein
VIARTWKQQYFSKVSRLLQLQPPFDIKTITSMVSKSKETKFLDSFMWMHKHKNSEPGKWQQWGKQNNRST